MKKSVLQSFRIVLLAASVAALLTGCFPSPQSTPQAADDESEFSLAQIDQAQIEQPECEFPDFIEDREIESLVFNARVVLPEDFDASKKVSAINASPRAWKREEIVAGLSGGRQIADVYSGENAGPEDFFYAYTYDDASELIFYSGSIFYYTPQEKRFDYTYYFDQFDSFKEEDALRKLFPGTKIEGIEKDDALESALRVISLLELGDVLGQVQVYCMDADSVNRLQEEYDVRDKYGETVEKWNSEQDAYLLIYPVLYQNIPSLCMNATGENEQISSPKVYFIFGRNGLIAFSASGIFNMDAASAEGYICTPEAAVRCVKKSFENMILEYQIEITALRLAFVIRNDFQNVKKWRIEPVWFIDGAYRQRISSSPEGDHEKANREGSDYYMMISALSEEEIPIFAIGG